MKQPTRTLFRAATVVAGLCLAGAAAGEGDRQKSGGDKDSGDHQFVVRAFSSGLAEVKLGQMAPEYGSTPEVKRLAARLVDEHRRMNKELADLVGRKRLTLPRELDKRMQEKIEVWGQQKGIDFDRTYLKFLVEDHAESLALFEAEARNGRDPELKEFAAKALPKLREHLEKARALAETVKPPRRR